jgi:hypothetical protein
MLGISQETAEKIVNVRGEKGGGGLEKYRRALSRAEFDVLVERANSLSPQTLKEFQNNRMRSGIDAGMVRDPEDTTNLARIIKNGGIPEAALTPTPSAPATKRRTRRRPTSFATLEALLDNAVVEDIKRLEEARNRALVAGDIAAIDALYSDDYTSVVAGTFRTKAEVLADLKSGALKLAASSNDETNVRVYSNTAVVTGKTTSKVTDHGVDTSGQSYFTRVYINQKSRWRLVANHASRLTP